MDYSSVGVVNNEIKFNLSIDSGQLEVGANLVSFDFKLDWHGEFELHVEDVFDKNNTIPEISGPTYLEFNQRIAVILTYGSIDGDLRNYEIQPVMLN